MSVPVMFLIIALMGTSGATTPIIGGCKPFGGVPKPSHVLNQATDSLCAGITVAQLGASDSLTKGYRGYVAWCDSLRTRTIEFFARALALQLLPLLVCGFAFLRLNWRTLAGSWSLFLLTTLIAFELPIHRIDFGSPGRAWFLALALLAMVCTPYFLSFFLTRTVLWRRGVAASIYVLLLVMFLFNQIGS